jgi:adenylate cyclase
LSKKRGERRLTTILAADVSGYSRLMGADEQGTLAQLKVHRRGVVDPKIGQHLGRIAKTTGDGMLVEFASVVEAVSCAIEVQHGMVKRNTHVRDDLIIPIDAGRQLAAGIPGARFIVLQGQNHLLPEHEPASDRFFEGIKLFLGG